MRRSYKVFASQAIISIVIYKDTYFYTLVNLILSKYISKD
jgi:hypothetical protein